MYFPDFNIIQDPDERVHPRVSHSSLKQEEKEEVSTHNDVYLSLHNNPSIRNVKLIVQCILRHSRTCE